MDPTNTTAPHPVVQPCSFASATTPVTKEEASMRPMLFQLAQQVEAAIHSLPADSVSEYLQAIEVIPETVRTESRMADFLRAENYHPQNAAVRLVRYWKTRRWLYGERWLLHMAQSTTGTLNPYDIEILRSGYIKYVQTPVHGPTYVIDVSLLPRGVSRIQPRIAFYFFSSFPGDVTVLYVVKSKGNDVAFDSEIKATLEATATRVRRVYIVQVYESGKEHLLDFLGYQQRVLTQSNFKLPVDSHISANSVISTLKLLQANGFDRQCLPAELGGDFDQSKFDQWVRMRMSVEDVLGAVGKTWADRLRRNVALNVQKEQAAIVPVPKKLAKAKKQIQREKEYLSFVRRPGETEMEFQKRKNACYVRRNYHRNRMENMVMQSEAKEGAKRNEALKAENKRLRDLLAQAWCIVQSLEDGKQEENSVSYTTASESIVEEI
eukprot:scaffold8527_cov187-Amphora_coffeaeformis.AAC.2